MVLAQIRTGEADDAGKIAKIHVATWQDAYRGILPQSFLDNLSIERRANHWRDAVKYNERNSDKSVLYVVIEDDELRGFIACGAARDKDYSDMGEIYAIYVMPEYQKNGYGSKLFERAKSFLLDKGYKQAYVWSLEKNTATHRAYEKWGAKKSPDHFKDLDVDGVKVREIAHIWKW